MTNTMTKITTMSTTTITTKKSTTTRDLRSMTRDRETGSGEEIIIRISLFRMKMNIIMGLGELDLEFTSLQTLLSPTCHLIS